MSTVDPLEVMDNEIRIAQQKLLRYQRKAHARATRLGQRDINADRLCEWIEYRLGMMLAARELVAELIGGSHTTQAEQHAAGILRQNIDLEPSQLADGWAPR